MKKLTSYSIVLSSLVAALHLACAQPGETQATDTTAATLPHAEAPPYAFDRPEATYELPKALEEISGLTVLDDRHLGAVQDEDGRLFVINLQTGRVEDERAFGKDGDYEGIERVDDRLYVLRSDGTLYEMAGWQAKKLDTKKHDTELDAACDAEGLAYEAARHRLLVACKEDPGKELEHYKAVYAFDLTNEKLLVDPAYAVDVNTLNRRLDSETSLNRHIRQFVEPVADLSGFKPSGLAVHPVTRQVYVLSSVRKAVVALNTDGSIADAWPLPASLFEQPEGMAFLPNGDVFISNEGAKGRATLLRFTYRSER